MTEPMLVPLVIEALEDLTAFSPADLAGAPLIRDWTITGASAPHLVGRVVGHPTIRDGHVRTSVLIAISVEDGWARTLNRFYRLGPPLGGTVPAMTTGPSRLIGRIARTVTSALRARLLSAHVREGLVVCGAETMTLLALSVDLRGSAGVARLSGDKAKADAADGHANDLIELGLEVMRAGDWHAAFGASGREAVASWARTAAAIGRNLEARPVDGRFESEASGNRAAPDLNSGIAFPQIGLSSLVDEWRAGLVDAPARRDHGWPIVTGRIYGDPRFEDGKSVSLYGLPAPDRRTMRGLRRTYALGRKAKASS